MESPAKPTVFRCVPFDDDWITNHKLDLKVIYRRPVRDEWTGEQKLDPVTQLPRWDLTGPLPVRRHHQYLRKGFEYVTLADWQSLKDASPALMAKGFDPRDYVMDRRSGPWNDQFYLTSQVQVDSKAMDVLRAMVDKHGSEAIEESRRMTDPAFQLPPHLRDLKPGDLTRRAKEAAPAADKSAAREAEKSVKETEKVVKANA